MYKKNIFYNYYYSLSHFNNEIKTINIKELGIALHFDYYINPYSYCRLILPEFNIFENSIKEKIKK